MKSRISKFITAEKTIAGWKCRLRVGCQSFDVGSCPEHESEKSAKWMKSMLVIALSKMFSELNTK